MAPMKRPAASQAGGANKKPVTTTYQCNVVSTAVKKAELPAPVVDMLVHSMKQSLGVVKENRVEIQEKVVEMIGETLNAVEAGIKGKIAACESKVSEADGVKAARSAAEEAAAAQLVAKKEATEAAKQALKSSGEALSCARVAVADAESEQKTGDAELEAAAGKKAALEHARDSTYGELKAGNIPACDVNKQVAVLAKVGKEFEFDDSLITSMPAALTKTPDARGSFDGMVLQQVEEEFTKHITTLCAVLDAGAPGKRARANKVNSAQASLTAATLEEESRKAALKEAEGEQKEAEAAQKAAAQAVADFVPEMEQVANDLDAVKGSLEDLQEGALTVYKELVERTNVQPEEPEGDAEGDAEEGEAAADPYAAEPDA